MLAIKANYQNGKITLLDAIPEKVKRARLTIVIEPDEQENETIPAQEFKSTSMTSEADFEAIGMNEFFNNEDDKNINWEDYFGLK
ncbi:MAG: hypothetical protein PF481_05775 [Bacteroidales bacterium]|jgi:hypothetical protein|nr:hypothetical protein [Bacteroidales bacterium]